MILVNIVVVRYALYMHSDQDHTFDETDSIMENEWTRHGFSPADADEWLSHGFISPRGAQRWALSVGDPELSGLLYSYGVDASDGPVWVELMKRHGNSFAVEKLLGLLGADTMLAMVYERYFPLDEWEILVDAGVTTTSSSAVNFLSASIQQRDLTGKEGRTDAIYEASAWASSGPVTPVRTSLLQNVILRGKTPSTAAFIMKYNMDLPISADTAIQANQWAEDAGYRTDDEGMAAYSRLVEIAHLHRTELDHLVSQHGVRKVTSALEAGTMTIIQLEHYLTHGGVAEISRGVL